MNRCVVFTALGTPLVDLTIPKPAKGIHSENCDAVNEEWDHRADSIDVRSLGQLVGATVRFQSNGRIDRTNSLDPTSGEGLVIRLDEDVTLVIIALSRLFSVGICRANVSEATVRNEMVSILRILLKGTAELLVSIDGEKVQSDTASTDVQAQMALENTLDKVNEDDIKKRERMLNQVTAISGVPDDDLFSVEESFEASDIFHAPLTSVSSIRKLWNQLGIKAVRGRSTYTTDESRIAAYCRENDMNSSGAFILHCSTKRLTAFSGAAEDSIASSSDTGVVVPRYQSRFCVHAAPLSLLAAIGKVMTEKEFTSLGATSGVVFAFDEFGDSLHPLTTAEAFTIMNGHFPDTCIVIPCEIKTSSFRTVHGIWNVYGRPIRVHAFVKNEPGKGADAIASAGTKIPHPPPHRNIDTSVGCSQGAAQLPLRSLSAKHQNHRRLLQQDSSMVDSNPDSAAHQSELWDVEA